MEDEQYLGLCIIVISIALLFYSFTVLSQSSESALILGFQLLGGSVILMVAGAILFIKGKKKRKTVEKG